MSIQNQNQNSNKSIVLFENFQVRRKWIEKEEKWYFAIIDIVAILAESINPTDYIKKMKLRDEELSKGWGQIVTPLKIETKGGPQEMRVFLELSNPSHQKKQNLLNFGLQKLVMKDYKKQLIQN